MIPQTLTPDRSVSLIERISKYDDPDVLDAAIRLVIGLSGLDDPDRRDPGHIAKREDAARAALDFAYRKTSECDRHLEEDLGIAV